MKPSLRALKLAERAALPPEEAAAASARICPLISDLIADNAPVTGAYIPMRGEVDILPALMVLHARGVSLTLPCVAEKDAPLVFRSWQPGEALERGVHGTLHPPESAPEAAPGLLLVPLVAFDAERHRLGYGGGYYDRTIAALKADNPALKAYGIAFSCQRVDALAPEAHDRRLDAIITEQGII